MLFFLINYYLPVSGQIKSSLEEKKSMKEYEFIVSDKVNDLGSFVTYFLKKGNEKTLILKSLITGKTRHFPDVHKSPVLLHDLMICYNYKKKELYRVNLDNFDMYTLKNVSDYHWIDSYEKLLVYEDKTKILSITDKNFLEYKRIQNVMQFYISPDKSSIAVITSLNQLEVYKLSKDKAPIISEIKDYSTVKTVKWLSDNTQFFIVSSDKCSFEVSVYKDKRVNSVYKGELIDSEKKTIIDTSFSNVRVLDDSTIAFGIKFLLDKYDQYKPEIWLGHSKNISTAINKKKYLANQLGILNLKNQSFNNLSDKSKVLQFSINHTDKMIFAYEELDDYSKYLPDIGVYKYSTDLKERKFFDFFTGHRTRVFNLKDKDGLFYLKDDQWYYYNDTIENLRKINELNEAIFSIDNDIFHFKQNDLVAQLIVSKDEKNVFFNDLYDIWEYNLENNRSTRKTLGREEGRAYSLTGLKKSTEYEPWSWSTIAKLPKADGILLQWRSLDFNEEGVSIIMENSNIIHLFKDHARFTQVYRNGDFITYKKERADTPAELYLFDLNTKQETLLYKSNAWDVMSNASQTEYIKWKDSNNYEVGAVVRLPVGYDENQNYPAIFSIYENRSEAQHYYSSPFENDVSGFNYRHYTENGYIIVEPDIYYEYGSPGSSATKNVLGALEKVSKFYSIDMDNIGLIGHSFGGYETNFIISQTNRFKTAVSGAGISDIISWYLSVNQTNQRPEFWRYSGQSFRMKDGLFDIPEKYLHNSPILQSQNINTPLLLWTGKEDYHVNWNQSVEMFLALKKLGKEVNLLLYPKEQHTLYRENSKADLKNKLMSWFDYYLKGTCKPLWLKEEGLP